MAIDYKRLEDALCDHLCAQVKIISHPRAGRVLQTPFTFPDGDPLAIYLEEIPSGGLRLTDKGDTLMRISYEMDVDTLYKGARKALKEDILREMNAHEDDGEFYIETSVENLSSAIFHYGQTLTKIYDLLFLSKSRVVSTFYDELYESLLKVIGEEMIERDYKPIPKDDDYWADYKIERARKPIFLFGVPSRDKARFTTIMLEHFLRQGIVFESLLIFEEYEELPQRDVSRLMNVGDSMISSLSSAEPDFHRKLKTMTA